MSDREAKGAPSPLQIIEADTLYAPEETPGPVAVVVDGARIRYLWKGTTAAQACQRLAGLAPDAPTVTTELRGQCLAPGFIDLHIHGFHGYDVNACSAADLREMARLLTSTGTTAFYPTIATTGPQETARRVCTIVEAAREAPADSSAPPHAEIAGLRLEGPFISPVKKGAQFADAIRTPDPGELRRLVELGKGLLRFVDFAPEEDEHGQLLEAIVRLGLVACIGHTNATYEQTVQAIEAGARHSTHLFNAMSALTHRAPGAPGALLTDERATVEVIADGVHLAPALLQLALRARGAADVALVTDAMLAAGLPDGDYQFLQRNVRVRDRIARLADNALAGSTLTLDQAVRNMVTITGVTWAQAVEMATATPARIAGIDSHKGHLVPGYDADLVALDRDGAVTAVWVRGELAYRANALTRAKR